MQGGIGQRQTGPSRADEGQIGPDTTGQDGGCQAGQGRVGYDLVGRHVPWHIVMVQYPLGPASRPQSAGSWVCEDDATSRHFRILGSQGAMLKYTFQDPVFAGSIHQV